jgi:hypothetical protein
MPPPCPPVRIRTSTGCRFPSNHRIPAPGYGYGRQTAHSSAVRGLKGQFDGGGWWGRCRSGVWCERLRWSRARPPEVLAAGEGGWASNCPLKHRDSAGPPPARIPTPPGHRSVPLPRLQYGSGPQPGAACVHTTKSPTLCAYGRQTAHSRTARGLKGQFDGGGWWGRCRGGVWCGCLGWSRARVPGVLAAGGGGRTSKCPFKDGVELERAV